MKKKTKGKVTLWAARNKDDDDEVMLFEKEPEHFGGNYSCASNYLVSLCPGGLYGVFGLMVKPGDCFEIEVEIKKTPTKKESKT